MKASAVTPGRARKAPHEEGREGDQDMPELIMVSGTIVTVVFTIERVKG